jgi:hypothetical protein
MKSTQKVGIWMDHAQANVIAYSNDLMTTRTLDSTFDHQGKEDSLKRSEQLMHNKEQHEEAEYYKKIAAVIQQYDDVLLFGPTDAKLELVNILKADHRFAKIKIEVQPADKMTENEQHAFVRDHFAVH